MTTHYIYWYDRYQNKNDTTYVLVTGDTSLFWMERQQKH